MLYQLSYILRGSLVYMTRAASATPIARTQRPGAPASPEAWDQALSRRAAMIFTNDLLRISSSVSPVARASCSVTAPHAMPRRK